MDCINRFRGYFGYETPRTFIQLFVSRILFKVILDKIKLVQDLTACSNYSAPVSVESGLRCVVGIGDQDLSLWCDTLNAYCGSAKERKKPDQIHGYREQVSEGCGDQVISGSGRCDKEAEYLSPDVGDAKTRLR